MFLAHGPASYIANEVIQKEKISKLKLHEEIIIGACSILFGILPDLDLLALMMTNRPPFNHHTLITHTPIFYIGIWLILLLITKVLSKHFNSKTSKVLNKNFLNILLNTFLISTLFHLLMDLLASDIMIFYPLTSKSFAILKYVLEPAYWGGFFCSTGFAIEILIVTIFVYMFLIKYLKRNKVLNIVSKTFIVISALYTIFTFGMSRFTYNSSYMRDTNGNINYDIDFDSLKDTADSDIGNDGSNNLEDADKNLISKKARYIVESNKYASNGSESFVEGIKNIYGALNSYGIVTQAYFDCHKPIPPVLRDYYNSKNTGSYSNEYQSVELLNQYLNEKDDLIELNLEANALLAPGRIFFVKDLDNNIVNLGITLENNELAIVLEDDTKLQLHRYTELRSKLGNDIKIEIQK